MKDKFFSRPISLKENIKFRKQENTALGYRAKNSLSLLSTCYIGDQLPDVNLAIIYTAPGHGNFEIESEVHELKYSFEWPCYILLRAAENVNFPLSSFAYSSQTQLLYFPLSSRIKVVSAFIHADLTIDNWQKKLSFLEKILGTSQPEFNSIETQSCLKKVISIIF